MKSILPFVLLISCALANVNAQSKAEKKAEKRQLQQEQFERILKIITHGNFSFIAQWATPMDNDVQQIGLNLPGGNAVFQGNRVNLSDGDNVVVFKDTKNAKMQLAYFGRIFVPNYGTEKAGITFSGEITEYSLKTNRKKQRTTIRFKAKNKTELYNCTLIISSKTNVSLIVNSAKRQTIRYSGYIKAVPQ